MPTNSIKASNRKKAIKRNCRRSSVTIEILNKAREKIKKGGSIRGVARGFGIPESTLRKRLKATSIPDSPEKRNPFNEKLERKLAVHLIEVDQILCGLTKKHFMHIAYEYAEAAGIEHQFSHTTKMADEKWFIDFCQRHNLTLGNLDKNKSSVSNGLSREQVNDLFDYLKEMYSTFKSKNQINKENDNKT